MFDQTIGRRGSGSGREIKFPKVYFRDGRTTANNRLDNNFPHCLSDCTLFFFQVRDRARGSGDETDWTAMKDSFIKCIWDICPSDSRNYAAVEVMIVLGSDRTNV